MMFSKDINQDQNTNLLSEESKTLISDTVIVEPESAADCLRAAFSSQDEYESSHDDSDGEAFSSPRGESSGDKKL